MRVARIGEIGSLVLLGWLSGCTTPSVIVGGGSDDLLAKEDLSPFPIFDLSLKAGLIPKTGTPYDGSHKNPMLDTLSDCPARPYEPDDDLAHAHNLFSAGGPDTFSICPVGPAAKTGKHDIDYFRIDVLGGPQTLMTRIFCDISFGDLDVALVDSKGNILAADGSSVKNGCVTAKVSAGVFYALVVGANDVDVNSYTVMVKTSFELQTCPVQF